ncbi:neurensin 1-like isoform X3 [Embiotoca jacksoni]|uniref:neurensin 1-like isoform X3 n=1 Tax=Embiotoca jacksoni TaxID=100190 RepID=UPI00370427C6
MWATGPITVHTELAPGDASGAPLQVKCPRTSNCSVVVASTKLRSLTGALQKAQCEALAAEEEKEPNISVMHLSAGAKGASGSKEAAVFITGTVLPTYRWTGPDQLHIKTCKEAKTKPGSHCATQSRRGISATNSIGSSLKVKRIVVQNSHRRHNWM